LSTPQRLSSFSEPLLALQRLIERFHHRGVLIGGMAASLLGKPRLTADLDALFFVSTQELPVLLESAESEGFKPRIEQTLEFAQKNRVLLLTHTQSRINLDIILGALPFEEEVIQRSQVMKIGGIAIRVPTPEDLIILKAVAHRPQDLLDVRSILDSHPETDKQRVRKWILEFAALLENPSLWEDMAELFE